MAYKSTNYKEDELQIIRVAKALSHPARIAILKLLASMDTCFCGEIVEELPIAPGHTTYPDFVEFAKRMGVNESMILKIITPFLEDQPLLEKLIFQGIQWKY